MASSIIHIAVANEVNKVLKCDNSKYLIGAIAPDISKCLGESKVKSHFQDTNDDIPNIDKFLNKYKKYLNDDFVMGYFVHIYTDYLWFKYFISEIYDEDIITKLDGTKVKCTGNMLSKYIYSDYTNMNIQLINKYNMNLDIFFNEAPKLNNIITEIPMDKIQLIIDDASVLIENSKLRKDLIFNIDNIDKFIKTSTDLVLAELHKIQII